MLYADLVFLDDQIRPEYVWTVDTELAAAARRFVEAFNGLFGPELPPPEARYASIFYEKSEKNDVVGRCVRLGGTPDQQRHYHWAIVAGPMRMLAVHEFWDARVWTTAEYQRAGRDKGGATRVLGAIVGDGAVAGNQYFVP